MIILLVVVLIVIILIGIIIAVNIATKNESDVNETHAADNNQETSQLNNSEENISSENDNMNNQSKEIKINLIVNNKTFSATLEDNGTTRELISMFPMTLNMSDLNSNEKYNYLDSRLTTNSTSPRRINAGDIKLYGSNCLVVFYESFNTTYSYTNLGKVDNANAFVDELGRGGVTITFEIAE